jgi:hypothetical protein
MAEDLTECREIHEAGLTPQMDFQPNPDLLCVVLMEPGVRDYPYHCFLYVLLEDGWDICKDYENVTLTEVWTWTDEMWALVE